MFKSNGPSGTRAQYVCKQVYDDDLKMVTVSRKSIKHDDEIHQAEKAEKRKAGDEKNKIS